jgi:hypothetical protein
MTTALTTRNALFWDINPKDIARTLAESDEWVIARVFNYGTLDDIFDVIRLYGKDKARQLLTTAHLNRVGCVMANLFLDVEADQNASH